MSTLSSATIGLAIVGDDLATCIVRRSATGAERRDGPVIRRFLSLSGDDAARQLAEVAVAGARIVLALPGSACAVRPIALTTRTWAKARAEIQRAVPSLFPLTAEDALLSLIDAAPKDDDAGTPESGWLIATSRQRMEIWRTAIERAVGRGIDEVIPFHAAVAALGLQHDQQATVIESVRTGGARAHRFRYAHPTQLSQPAELDHPDPNDWTTGRLITLSDKAQADAATPTDLAVAAANASRLARDGGMAAFVPFVGRVATPRSRLVMPLAGIGAAAAMVTVAIMLGNARMASATERVEADREEIVAQVSVVREQRERYQGLAKRIKLFAQLTPAAQPRVLPLLASAQQSVPVDGFLYRVDLDAQMVTIRGEAPRTLDVLARLEATEHYRSAESLEPPAMIKDRTLESFHIRARRADLPARSQEAPR